VFVGDIVIVCPINRLICLKNLLVNFLIAVLYSLKVIVSLIITQNSIYWKPFQFQNSTINLVPRASCLGAVFRFFYFLWIRSLLYKYQKSKNSEKGRSPGDEVAVQSHKTLSRLFTSQRLPRIVTYYYALLLTLF